MRPLRLVPLILLLLLAAAPAADARRKVPYGFFGANANGALSRASQGAQERAWASMARSGVESARVLFSWANMQSSDGGPIDFEHSDAIVSRAARRRIRLLPVLFDAPHWARLYQRRFQSPPRDNGEFAAFARQVVGRYGTHGRFWAENPELPRRPVVEWQIWNEPHLRFYWNVPKRSQARWPRGYARLLAETARAIRHRDRRAKIVLGGLTNRSWDYLRALYRLRMRRYFDAVAVQTYTSSPRSMLRVFRLVRRVMRRYHDRRKPIWATELGWPAARGRVRHMRKDERSFTTTDRRMARRLSTMYAYLAARRRNRRYRVTRAYWYTWATTYRGSDLFDYAGLLKVDLASDSFSPRRALRAYRRSARRYEGCSKTSTGRCSRR